MLTCSLSVVTASIVSNKIKPNELSIGFNVSNTNSYIDWLLIAPSSVFSEPKLIWSSVTLLKSVAPVLNVCWLYFNTPLSYTSFNCKAPIGIPALVVLTLACTLPSFISFTI